MADVQTLRDALGEAIQHYHAVQHLYPLRATDCTAASCARWCEAWRRAADDHEGQETEP